MSTVTEIAGIRCFEVLGEVTIDAPRARVFDAVTIDVPKWFLHRAVEGSPVTIELRLGGRVFEDWGNGDGMLWTTIVAMKRPSFIRLRGEWGVAGPVQIVVTYHLEEAGTGTLLKSSHLITGRLTDEEMGSYTHVAGALGENVTAYLAREKQRSR